MLRVLGLQFDISVNYIVYALDVSETLVKTHNTTRRIFIKIWNWLSYLHWYVLIGKNDFAGWILSFFINLLIHLSNVFFAISITIWLKKFLKLSTSVLFVIHRW